MRPTQSDFWSLNVPGEGRYLSPDPLGMSSTDLNGYAYNFGDPLNGVDPLGLFTVRDGLDAIGLDTVGFTIGIDGGAAGGNVAVYTDGERYRVCVAGGKGVQTAPLIEFNPDIPSHSTTLTAGAELGAGVAAIGTEATVTYQWDEQCFEASLDTGLDVGPMSFDMFHQDERPEWSAIHTDEMKHDFALSLSLNVTHCF